MYPDFERHVQKALPPLRYSWALMVATSLAWAGMGLIASPVVALSDTGAAPTVTKVLAVLGVLCALATLLVDRAVITPRRMAALIPVPDHALLQRHLLGGHLVLWTLALLPAVFGFAQLLLAGTLVAHLALCALSLIVLALLLPTRARVAARMEAVLR